MFWKVLDLFLLIFLLIDNKIKRNNNEANINPRNSNKFWKIEWEVNIGIKLKKVPWCSLFNAFKQIKQFKSIFNRVATKIYILYFDTEPIQINAIIFL